MNQETRTPKTRYKKMTVRKFFAACLACVLSLSFGVKAESFENTIYTVALGNIEYTPKEESTVKSTLLSVGKALLTGETSSQLSSYADDVRAAVVQGVAGVRRLTMSEGDASADYYVDGTITNITTTSKLVTPTNSTPYTGYRAQIRVSLNLRKASDGSIVDSRTFNTSEYSYYGWLTSQETAVNKALTSMADEIDSAYEQLFPLYAQLEEAGEVKKDKQKEVYISLGSKFGAFKNEEFDVYAVKTIGTKEARQEIGRIKVSEVMGDEVSRCKVTKGGDKIKAAIDAGSQLIFVSR
jgi:hypothetical protein